MSTTNSNSTSVSRSKGSYLQAILSVLPYELAVPLPYSLQR